MSLPNTLLAQSLNTLAIPYRFGPNTQAYAAVAEFFAEPEWPQYWIDSSAWSESLPQLKTDLSEMNALSEHDWREFFGVEQSLPVPLWASVYLDHEGLLNSESTSNMEAFLTRFGIEVDTGEREPVDHLGIQLMVMASLAQQQRLDVLQAFYREHVAIWVDKYFAACESFHREQELPEVIRAWLLLTQLSLDSLRAQRP
ncbi:TorD/DmsD family molecular chaperone [Paraferrimonas sedimenticola]|uniref:Chaperone TorD involved in molybdoenzyme TorA maturation n=1 Tax=Paraferrimonas sedimenticola TaxID=375674 RepID=A0AA37RVI6_9GAMM|nr:molecular chaperone TorD family protein [Paraferrimonas sedimenticola]GLP95687.1 hypothetical protein GCM10007895_09930 [Paraferrimonas sedimenticola]